MRVLFFCPFLLTIGSISIGQSNQSRSGAANVTTGVCAASQLKRLRELQRLLNKIQKRAEQFQDFFELLELSQTDLKELKSSFNALSALPARKIGPVKIPIPSKITKELRWAVNMARRIGGLQFLQEQLGEWGTSIISGASGLQHTKMTLHTPQGIDQLRFHKDAGFWAVIEAKGGTSRLSKEASYGAEMSPKWIRHWIKDTLGDTDNSAGGGDVGKEHRKLKSTWDSNRSKIDSSSDDTDCMSSRSVRLVQSTGIKYFPRSSTMLDFANKHA